MTDHASETLSEHSSSNDSTSIISSGSSVFDESDHEFEDTISGVIIVDGDSGVGGGGGREDMQSAKSFSNVSKVAPSETTSSAESGTTEAAEATTSTAASTATPPSANSNIDRLLRKLSNYETTINELMSLRRSTSILKEKLSNLDELILDIPNEHEDMASQWRVKVAGWWREYATFSAEEAAAQRELQAQQQAAATATLQQHSQDQRHHHPQLSLAPTGGGTPLMPMHSYSWPPSSSTAAAMTLAPPPPAGPLGPIGAHIRSFSAPPKPIGSQLSRSLPSGDQQQQAINRRQMLVNWGPSAIGSPTSGSTPLTYAQVSQIRSSPPPQVMNAHHHPHHKASTLTSPGSSGSTSGTPRFGASPNLPEFPDANCYNAFTGPITKHSLRAQLEAAFDQLNDVCEGSMIGTAAYIDGMQKLLAAVAKAIKAIIPYVSDDQLLLEVSSYAIAKMPAEKQIEFNGRYERHSLFNLMRFLRKEIVMYYEKFNAAGISGSALNLEGGSKHLQQPQLQQHHQLSSGLAGSSNTGGGGSSSASSSVVGGDFEEQVPYCVYCRHDGHRVHECPIKRGMLCFKCYEFGHTLKCCPNATLINIK